MKPFSKADKGFKASVIKYVLLLHTSQHTNICVAVAVCSHQYKTATAIKQLIFHDFNCFFMVLIKHHRELTYMYICYMLIQREI